MKLTLQFLGIIALGAAHIAAQCTGQITISSQSDADALSDCDTVSGTVNIGSDASGTITLPDLEELRGALNIEGASNLNSLRANDIETITGPVTIKDNGNLNEVSLSNLQDLGGQLRVEGNDNLKTFALNDLQTVTGQIYMSGAFDQISFPSLQNLQGRMEVLSTGSFSCSSLQGGNNSDDGDEEDNNNNNIFSGASFSCKTGADATSTSSTSTATSTGTSTSSSTSSSTTSTSTNQPTSTSPPDSGSGLTGGAIAGIVIGVIAVILLIIFMLWFMTRRRRKNAGAGIPPTTIAKDTEKQPPGGSDGDPTNNSTHDSSPSTGEIPPTHGFARKPIPPAAQKRLSAAAAGVPLALVPGDNNRSSTLSPDDGSLFLNPIPRQVPSEADVPMLDSGHVHEAPTEVERPTPVYEMDAGPVSSHQQPINRGVSPDVNGPHHPHLVLPHTKQRLIHLWEESADVVLFNVELRGLPGVDTGGTARVVLAAEVDVAAGVDGFEPQVVQRGAGVGAEKVVVPLVEVGVYEDGVFGERVVEVDDVGEYVLVFAVFEKPREVLTLSSGQY
ncbi:hypothetical protein FE257_011742 [Aspergillus nanangensis]|uniref:Receptor L-domain domain-containing protein n=1 Tax=Aspergillus nanangensis TaxID=2582783 RepID=A0AAD4CX32_ASPNN|nr:hypothetical protein FE257_011742 [Aspergillus nanangensis]